jgi:5'-3' exonuclease
MKGWDLPVRDPRKEGSNLLLVDGMNFSFRYKHSGATKFSAEYIKDMRSFAKSYNCTDILILSDKKGSKYRKEIYPEYKGNRDYSNQTDAEKARAEAFFEEYNKTIATITDLDDMECFYRKGIEADDFAAVIVADLKDSYDNIWMISTDGDWDELLDNNVHRFAYGSRKEFFIDSFFEQHGCDTPEQFVMMKCLRGDMSDNIKGVDGMGEKRSYGVLRNYESIFDIVDDLPLAGNQQYIKNLNAFGEKLILNLELMDLRTFSREIIEHTDPEATIKLNELIARLPTGSADFAELLEDSSIESIEDI